ncbi:MAG TPA: bifunctional rhamnulose-1-phosphate aldolase/short-chain dehydrogenase [Candidatus Dormibacteraeota bacterium]|nr:bifunctional rhamnulose-1-phosphate aldolase/short-chain dehydrogenase [Candidatus Dormibacteraeota bacterium]
MPADLVDQLIYRSNLLGADLRITNYGGGNTSLKVRGSDPVSGEDIEILWIKGSGGDLGTLRRTGLAALDNGRVAALERTYRGVDHEDDQVALLADCLVAPRQAAPSIDTPLHALVPHPHVDHVHPDALIAFATAGNGRRLVEELYGGTIGWLEWQRPGYDLALKLRDAIRERPDLEGLVLGGHGLITWAETAEACYERTLRVIERAADEIERRRGAGRPFGGVAVAPIDGDARRRQATRALPLLRGLASGERSVIATFRDDDVVLDFAGSERAAALVEEGTSCPDHFLRTKKRPLLLDLPPAADPAERRDRLEAAFDAYREGYASYYRANADGDSPAMRSSSPVIILWPGVGMFSLAQNKRESRIAGEFYVNAINVMSGAETLGGYHGLSDSEAFRIEYWALEEAKLRRMPPERPLSRRVALVTGAAGGIGGAIARRLTAEGASVVVADLDLEGAQSMAAELGEQAVGVAMDVTDERSIEEAFERATLTFGGVDLLINNAGISISSPLLETTLEDYEKLHRVIDRGSFLTSRAFARQAIAQGIGGDIVYVVSKNAVVAGTNNIGYSSTKAAQLHQMRLLAVELAPYGIRVNGINPDAVIRGSKIFAGDWGDNRARTYGVPREQLGEYYAQRTLLKREVLPDDVAAACFLLVSGELAKTTGAVIPVDGGIQAAFPR